MNTTERINVFNAIRDIPYRVDAAGRNATCSAKNKMLGQLLSRLGMTCVMQRGICRWDQLPFPEELIKLAPGELFNHVFLKVLVPETNEWIAVDATWDSGLKHVLPVAKWDGLHSTQLACLVKEVTDQGAPEDYPFREFDPFNIFSIAFNSWLEKVRKL